MVTARRAPCPAIIKVHSRESAPPPMSRLYRVSPKCIPVVATVYPGQGNLCGENDLLRGPPDSELCEWWRPYLGRGGDT
ncbi:hypothetical protein GE21DRAFT_1290778 [Neurospora crassa]|nr:hypothetical protein GE21DRAFT_1290778 [Neurospora crassa]